MKTKPLFLQISALLSIAFLIQSCSPPKPGTYADDKIPSGQQSTLHDLNKQLLYGLKGNDAKGLASLFSKEMIDNHSNLKTVEVISNHMKEGDYSILNEYYIVNDQKGEHTINVSNQNINNHDLRYNADTREMYIVFYGQKTVPNQWLVSVVYNKLDYGWKVTQLDIEPYTKNGKTAAELYEQAKDDYGKKYLVDAVNLMALSKVCVNPWAGWKYVDEKEMDAFEAKLIEAANNKYRFPYVVSQVPTQPRIIRIATQTTNEGVFPQIYYQTSIKLSNTAGLKKENDELQKVIGNVVPGIDKNNRYIYYSAFNKLPNYYESVDRYEVTEKLK